MDGKVANTLDLAPQLHVELVSETPEGKFSLHSSWRAKRVNRTLSYTESIRIRRTWLREGLRCVNVLRLPESLYLICPPYVGRHSGGELFS